jgi:aminopeptidase N
LTNPKLDKALIAEAISLPTEGYLAEQMEVVDVDAIHRVRDFVQATLGQRLREALADTYRENLRNDPYVFDPISSGRRRLKNLALEYLMTLRDKEHLERCVGQFENSDNMTDVLGAFRILVNTRCAQRGPAIEAFLDRWSNDSLVIDKWFTTQATSQLPGTLDEVKELLCHEAFNLKNPNKVRALIGAFCYGNQVRFHDESGEGYEFLADRVLELDPLNPQVAARLLSALSRWRKFDQTRQELMQMELRRILAAPKISRDVYEIATKTLG